MKKRLICMILAAITLTSLTACGKTEKKPKYENLEDFSAIVEQDIEGTISPLTTEYEELIAEIDTYDKYLSDTSKIEAFYNKIYETHRDLCSRMYEYSLDYAKIIISSDKSNDDKYEELEDLREFIYDDSGDEIYDKVYDGLMSDMYDAYYDGVLDDAYKENASNSEWYDIRSDEYDSWSDARSDIYDDFSDCRHDIYEFLSDLKREVYDNDIEKAEKKIDDFSKDIEKLKSDK